jgi:hypothetical protein
MRILHIHRATAPPQVCTTPPKPDNPKPKNRSVHTAAIINFLHPFTVNIYSDSCEQTENR